MWYTLREYCSYSTVVRKPFSVRCINTKGFVERTVLALGIKTDHTCQTLTEKG